MTIAKIQKNITKNKKNVIFFSKKICRIKKFGIPKTDRLYYVVRELIHRLIRTVICYQNVSFNSIKPTRYATL